MHSSDHHFLWPQLLPSDMVEEIRRPTQLQSLHPRLGLILEIAVASLHGVLRYIPPNKCNFLLQCIEVFQGEQVLLGKGLLPTNIACWIALEVTVRNQLIDLLCSKSYSINPKPMRMIQPSRCWRSCLSWAHGLLRDCKSGSLRFWTCSLFLQTMMSGQMVKQEIS